jgi:hypothetical protein
MVDVLAMEGGARMMKRKVRARRMRRPASSGGGDKRSIARASFPGRSHNPFKQGPSVVTISFAPRPVNPKPYSLDEWIQLIREACSRGANSTLELARLMSQARRTLPYGRWSQLWRSDGLRFSRRKGEMLVVIGQCVKGLDAQNSAQLPAAWNTLYYLARLGRVTVERLIEQGRIHPGLSLREAQAMLAEHRPGTPQQTPQSKLRNRLARFAAFIRGGLEAWPQTEREWAGRQLMALAGEVLVFTKPARFGEAKHARFDSSTAACEAQPASLRRTSPGQSIQICKL